MVFCSECGANLGAAPGKFCSTCGKPVGGAAPAKAAAPAKVEVKQPAPAKVAAYKVGLRSGPVGAVGHSGGTSVSVGVKPVGASRVTATSSSYGEANINHTASGSNTVSCGLATTTYEKQPDWAFAGNHICNHTTRRVMLSVNDECDSCIERHKNQNGQYRTGQFRKI